MLARRMAAAAGVVVVILLDLGLVATGIPAKRGQARERREALTRSVNSLEKDLPVLQKESDDDRHAILNAVDALDELLNLGRRPKDIAAADPKLPGALELMDSAQRANARLPSVTEEILTRAESGISDARQLRALVGSGDARYLEALGEALEVMIETHRIYSGMNSLLSQGLQVYEELTTLTNDFLTKHSAGFFRNDTEAARWFTLRTDPMVGKIESFKTQLQTVTFQAQEAAEQAERAFDRVEELAH